MNSKDKQRQKLPPAGLWSHRYRRGFCFTVLICAAACLLAGGCGRRELVLSRGEDLSLPASAGESTGGRKGDLPADTGDGEGSAATGSADGTVSEGSAAADLTDGTAGESAASSRIRADETERAPIYVHVTGAVCFPGVYSLPGGARVYEAVDAAGGFTDEADSTWCNLALILQDEDMLRIYTGSETDRMREDGLDAPGCGFGIIRLRAAGASQQTGGSAAAAGMAASAPLSDTDGKIDLNTATMDELMRLPGIGQSRAEDIIAYREMNGGFHSIEEIMQISGIKHALFDRISGSIRVS